MKQQDMKITCDSCGKPTARIRKLSRTYGKGKDILVIEDVPVIQCSSCGESYITAETAHEIERIKSHRTNLAKKQQVEVAHFA